MIKKNKVGIVNYNCGNIASLQASLNLIGYRSNLINTKSDFAKYNTIIIPGVGAFPNAMYQLQKSGLINGIYNSAHEGKKIIGICIGMQLLTDFSYEFKKTKGLGLIKGSVLYHPNGLQVGWMRIKQNKKIKELINFHEKQFYFNHSYYVECEKNFIIFSNNDFGNNYPSIIKNKNITGIQFHPEKSQVNGLKFLSSILSDYDD